MIAVRTELEDESYQINSSAVETFVARVVADQGIERAHITVIFGTDTMLRNLKKQFFNEDTFTDVIAFRLNDDDQALEGEIYISPEMALENSRKYRVSLDNELSRLIFHGSLHLLGYRDDTPRGKAQMHTLEDYYLNQTSTRELLNG